MKKVLFVIHSLGYGGAERSLVNLLNELPENRYQIDLLLFQDSGDFRQQVPKWVHMLDIPKDICRLYASVRLGGCISPRRLIGTCFSKLARKTRKQQRFYRWQKFYRRAIKPLPVHYDVAVAYVGSEIMYFVRDKVDADRKLVWIHNDYRTAGYAKEDEYAYLACMDGIVSVSYECTEILRQEFPELKNRIQYIQNITSSTIVQNQSLDYMPQELVNCPYTLLSIGRLSQQKGFDMAIEAAAILRDRGLAFCWYVIGTGELKEELEKQIRQAGVENCFVLLGARSNPYPYIKHCNLFVQPSRFEGKSVVLDEAKILSKPIVATAYPTVTDQIENEKEGLIAPLSASGIADTIERMIMEQDLYDRIHFYLVNHDYGNEEELEKYMRLLDEEIE